MSFPNRGTHCAVAIILFLSAVSGCGAPPGSGDGEPAALPIIGPFQALENPAGAGFQPWLARGAGDDILLSWQEPDDVALMAFRFSIFRDGEWLPARTIATGDDFFVTAADVPSVVRLADGTLAAHWLDNAHEAFEAYDLRVRFSQDEGLTWSAPITPHDDDTVAQHGFASLFDAPEGGLGLVWLDGRDMPADAPYEPSQDGPEGSMALRYGRITPAGVVDVDVDVLLDSRACECCPTAAVRTASGAIVVAYRDRSEDEVRDIAVTRYANGHWSAPAVPVADGWQLAGCPVNGPALATGGGNVALAWFTAESDRPRAHVAFSADKGETFGPAIRVDDEASLGHVGVAMLDNGTAVVSWVEYSDGGSSIRVRAVRADGTRGPSSVVSGPTIGVPRILIAGNRLIAAWPEVPAIRTAVATLSTP